MATIESDDPEATGYFLPEDGGLRLKQLREYVGFLAGRAQPRRPGEGGERNAEIRVGEVAACLALLEAQLGQVLDGLCRPAERGGPATARKADADADEDEDAPIAGAAAPDAIEPGGNEAAGCYVAGVTLDQIDEMVRLLESLRALGNVVTCADHAELADTTLAIMGDAIGRDVGTIRDIVGDIDALQRLEASCTSQVGVREEGARYLALPRLPSNDAAHVMRSHPTCQ